MGIPFFPGSGQEAWMDRIYSAHSQLNSAAIDLLECNDKLIAYLDSIQRGEDLEYWYRCTRTHLAGLHPQATKAFQRLDASNGFYTEISAQGRNLDGFWGQGSGELMSDIYRHWFSKAVWTYQIVTETFPQSINAAFRGYKSEIADY